MSITDTQHTTEPQAASVATPKRRFTIGLPATPAGSAERRFPLTPEGVRMLADRGFAVMLEAGAAAPIHYSDAAYTRCGAQTVSRTQALGADIVISLTTPSPSDIAAMRRGAMLLTLLGTGTLTRPAAAAMLERGILAVAADLIADDHGHLPFADILSEIDGRAAIAMASSLLADSNTGKGILLGGIAGIIPCEVTIIGSGIAAVAAARSALGLGAIVKMFDDNAYSLRAASRDLGPAVIGSALHEKVLYSALRSADVIVVSSAVPAGTAVQADAVDSLKKGVLAFDLTPHPGAFFPALPHVSLADRLTAEPDATQRRVCFTNAGNAVPRTAAMALSNCFITMLRSVVTCEGLTNALRLTPGLRRGVITFFGKITNPDVARLMRSRASDIDIFLQLC